MLTPSLEPDTDRLSALYRYGILDSPPDAFLDAVAAKLAEAFGGMAVQIVLVDDHRLWTAASSGQSLEERGRPGTLAAAAIELAEPLVIDNAGEDLRSAQSPSVSGAPKLRAYAAVAIRTPDNYAIGVVAAADTVARAFRPEHTALLDKGAERVMERLEMRRRMTLDQPTGAMRRPAFHIQVTALAAVARRHRRDLSLLAVDIRALRNLLQSFDPDLGRLVLDRIGSLGRQNVRRLDSFGRLGDSIFAVLLPNTDEAGARSLGCRIVEGLAAGWCFPGVDGRATSPAGIGIATLRPHLDDAQAFVERAVQDCRRAWLDGLPRPAAPQVA